MNSQVKGFTERGPEGSQGQELLSPWSWVDPFHMQMCSLTQKPSELCTSGTVMEASSRRQDG